MKDLAAPLGLAGLRSRSKTSEVTLNFLIGALRASRCAYLSDIISEQKLDSR